MHIGAEPRLQARYELLVMAHLSSADRLAAGLRLPPSLTTSWALTQGAWRFYANKQVPLDQLIVPLRQAVRQTLASCPEPYLPVALDWCNLHYQDHAHKDDRIPLANEQDQGYELLTALAIHPTDGRPLAPLALELRAADGVHTTCASTVQPATSVLDDLAPLMAHMEGLKLPLQMVFILDREADSVGHYRAWDAARYSFLVRADPERVVLGPTLAEQRLDEVAATLRQRRQLRWAGPLEVAGQRATLHVGATHVVLHRPARQQRVREGVKRHVEVPGVPLSLRLIVSEVRDVRGKVLACWYLLTNVAESVSAAVIARWYAWRWLIESYHKLLKGAGQQVESWLQKTPAALAKRLLVAAMAATVVWQLARDQTPPAAELRQILIRLSGRQIKRGPQHRAFTEPALLAGLGVLMPVLLLLETHSLAELQDLVRHVLPSLPYTPRQPQRESG